MFKAIDGFVLGYVERFAHFMQRNFGIHPFFIAMCGNVLYAVTLKRQADFLFTTYLKPLARWYESEI